MTTEYQARILATLEALKLKIEDQGTLDEAEGDISKIESRLAEIERRLDKHDSYFQGEPSGVLPVQPPASFHELGRTLRGWHETHVHDSGCSAWRTDPSGRSAPSFQSAASAEYKPFPEKTFKFIKSIGDALAANPDAEVQAKNPWLEVIGAATGCANHAMDALMKGDHTKAFGPPVFPPPDAEKPEAVEHDDPRIEGTHPFTNNGEGKCAVCSGKLAQPAHIADVPKGAFKNKANVTHMVETILKNPAPRREITAEKLTKWVKDYWSALNTANSIEWSRPSQTYESPEFQQLKELGWEGFLARAVNAFFSGDSEVE